MEEKQLEVKQVSEREYWVGESRLFLDESNTLLITSVGDYDKKRALVDTEIQKKLMGLAPGKVKYLLDINKAGSQSSEARKIWKEITENDKVSKVAFIGLHPVARVMASFVMGISRNKNQRFFKTKEDALAWLKD
jgi:hypothetical protein